MSDDLSEIFFNPEDGLTKQAVFTLAGGGTVTADVLFDAPVGGVGFDGISMDGQSFEIEAPTIKVPGVQRDDTVEIVGRRYEVTHRYDDPDGTTTMFLRELT